MKLYAKLKVVCIREDGVGDTIVDYQIESVSTTKDEKHTFEFEEKVPIKLPDYDCPNNF